jgi:DNA-binding MarR family transcriptional regulator/N-acetylglutamate synthase-like GNAT family acetyltransferase
MKDQFLQFKELALGSRLKRLSNQLMKESIKIYSHLQIDFDPYHMPIFKLLNEQNDLTIGMVSKILNVTQPAITQYVNSLVKKQLLRVKMSKKDKRKKNIIVTSKGKSLYKTLQPLWKLFETELKVLSQNSDNKTLLEHIYYMENELKKENLSQRILSKKNLLNQLNNVEIIDFEERYSDNFRDLNMAWLKKYFYIEAHDKEVLENAKSYIIDKGGFIFFARFNNKIVGTVALINETEGFELSKMAVLPDYQGFKIGQLLMQYCIDFAKNKSWNKLILYSNIKLENAIYIYRKFGFQEVDLEKESPYIRSNIKMVLTL